MDVRGRMGTRYEDFLHQQVAAAGGGSGGELIGSSGYFGAPKVGLDPRLFDGEQLKPKVRKFLLDRLYEFWRQRYNEPERWSTVWIAGSAVSFQWSGEIGGVGDLDVLIGVNFTKFRRLNPDFVGFPEPMMASQLNSEMWADLWPTLAEHSFAANEDPFEITFYVNPGGADIRDIIPYAAYNVTADEWTVRPPELPEDWDPFTHFPSAWWEAARRRMERGRTLIARHDLYAGQVASLSPGTPQWVNASSQLKHATEAAVAFFDDIHQGRKAAFGSGGKGYFAPQNALWQYGKLTGIIDALRRIKSTHGTATRAATEAAYGDALTSSQDAMVRAALWGKRR